MSAPVAALPARSTAGGLADIELNDPLPALRTPATETGPMPVRLFLRLHRRPLGELDVQVGADELTASRLADHIWAAAGATIRAHLREDDLPEPMWLHPRGLAAGSSHGCLVRRRARITEVPHITVLVATRDRTVSLLRCLRSLSAVDYPRYDVVVVDSAPSDTHTSDVLSHPPPELGDLEVRYVREERPGLALAHNRGIGHARGAWVAIVDDDVVVDPGWLWAIAEGAAMAPGVSCVTGLILPAELATPAQRLLEEYGGYARGFSPRVYDLDRRRPEDPLFPYTAGRLGSGANMAFDAETLRAVGGFDPATGAGTPARGGDDLTAFLRVLRAGHALAYQPGALVWHWHPREYASLREHAYGYGVGLGAYLTSVTIREPRLFPAMLRRSLPAARHLFGRDSAKNRGKTASFPRELEVAERLGVARGPLAYAASRWRYRHEGAGVGPRRGEAGQRSAGTRRQR